MDDQQQAFLAKLSEVLEQDRLLPESALNAREWDSVIVLSVIALIDETYNVTLPIEQLQSVESVPALLELIREGTTNGAPSA